MNASLRLLILPIPSTGTLTSTTAPKAIAILVGDGVRVVGIDRVEPAQSAHDEGRHIRLPHLLAQIDGQFAQIDGQYDGQYEGHDETSAILETATDRFLIPEPIDVVELNSTAILRLPGFLRQQMTCRRIVGISFRSGFEPILIVDPLHLQSLSTETDLP